MRIALALQRDFPTGGLQRDARSLARVLTERGHGVCLVSREAEGEAPPGVERRLVPVGATSNHGRDLAFARRYRAAVADCDLVVGFDKLPALDLYFAADDCWRFRVGALKSLLPRGRVRRALEEAVFGRSGAPLILALTARQRDRYRMAWGTALDRFRLLPPLVDPVHRPPIAATEGDSLRAALGLAAGDRLALFVGRDAQLKGLDRLLSALAPLGDEGPHLLAVGEIGDSIKALARRLGLERRLHYREASDGLGACYAAADLVVHPARREAAGKVITEALANGLPVICSAACGYAPLVAAHRAGAVLSEPYDGGELTRLLGAFAEPGHRRRWQAGAARAARTLAPLDAIAALADLVEATGGRRPAMPRGLTRRGSSLLEPAALPLMPDTSDPFDAMAQADGTVHRRGPRRETLEIAFGGERLFLKRHRGVGLGEVLKNWASLRQPVVGALREWSALGRLAALGLPAAERLAYGRRGRLPTSRHSYLLMRPLPPAISLEDWLRGHPRRSARARAAREAGAFVASLHAGGLAHRDLYLCHLYRLEDGGLALLDLHRAVSGRPLAERWRVKDLAALLFSAHPFDPSPTELALFLEAYHAQPTAIAAARFDPFWQAIEQRAARFHAREDRRAVG